MHWYIPASLELTLNKCREVSTIIELAGKLAPILDQVTLVGVGEPDTTHWRSTSCPGGVVTDEVKLTSGGPAEYWYGMSMCPCSAEFKGQSLKANSYIPWTVIVN